MYNIASEKYNDDAFVIKGVDTIKFKDTFKEFGGKWNSVIGGWVFSLKLKNKLDKFLELINSDTEKSEVTTDFNLETIPTIQKYTDKSFILIGNTKPYKDKIKELGGSWNSKLKDGNKAWVFSLTKQKEVESWLNDEFGKNKIVHDVEIIEDEDEDDVTTFTNKKRLL
jgi:hypothetical protein